MEQIALLAGLLYAGVLLVSLFNLKKGGNMFLGKVAWLSTNYKGSRQQVFVHAEGKQVSLNVKYITEFFFPQWLLFCLGADGGIMFI
jgi:hypothetical protein